MKIYSKILLFSIITLLTGFLFTSDNIKFVHAETTDMTDHVGYINTIVAQEDYNTTIESIIKQHFSTFNIPASEFNSRVPGKSSYRILELTPRDYITSINEISDLNGSFNEIRQIYYDIATNQYYTDNRFIDNMQYFTLETMTIKQFVDNRDEIAGKYDAIVFNAGDYSPEKVDSCAVDYDINELDHGEIKNENIKIYQGYFEDGLYHGPGKLYDGQGNGNKHVIYEGEFKDGLYHGQGTLYVDGKKIYSGGFKNGNPGCYGVSYDDNENEKYRGQYKNGKKEGYGRWFSNGDITYEGFFHEDTQDPTFVPRDILDTLTNLKATELLNEYVLKDYPVFVHPNSQGFIDFIQTEYPNRTFDNLFTLNYTAENSNNNIDFYKALSIMKITELYSNKPHLDFYKEPVNFLTDTAETKTSYAPGDTIQFDYDLTNKIQVSIAFYVDINQNETFEPDEVAYSFVVNNGRHSFSYTIPNTYTGLLKYKIVVDSNKKVIYDGMLNIKGETVDIKVLNVVSEMVESKDGLLDSAYDDYFQNENYNITIDRCNIKDFSKNNDEQWDCSHFTVMDRYDVILLGQDIFDKPMNKHVYNSIQQQINKGKPIIFTSSVTKGNSKWVRYFNDDLSLDNYRTDIYKIENKVDKLQIVNQSKYNLYPFNMNNEDLIIPEDLNYALNEQYPLNLENENLVPLMNMYSSTNTLYDRFDSYNNFYFYQNENVIYVNVGNNSFKVYKEIEHKLLVNSIVNLFIQHQSKDLKVEEFFEISHTNEDENTILDVNDALKFSFSVLSNDEDDIYHYTVSANSELQVEGDISKNSLININLTDYASPSPNSLQQVLIELKIENSEHEIHTYDFYVFVGNFDNYNVTLYPTVLNGATPYNNETYVETNVDNTYYNAYEIKLNKISVEGLDVSKLPPTIEFTNMEFKQKIPQNITVNGINYTVTDNVLSKFIGNYTYTLQGNYYVPNAYDPISLTLPFTVNATGDYTFEKASVTFDGFGNDTGVVENNNVDFTAIKPLDETMVTPIFEDYLFIAFGEDQISDLRKKFIISDEPALIDNPITFTLDTTGAQKLKLTTYKLEAIDIGEQYVWINVTDIFGNSVNTKFKVLSYQPITMLDLDDQSLYEGDNTTITFPYDARNIKWELISETVKDVAILSYSGNNIVINGNHKGYANYRFYGYDDEGYEVETFVTILVNDRVAIYFDNFFMSVLKGETITYDELMNNLQINTSLTDKPKNEVIFTSESPTLADFDVNGDLLTYNAGTAIITATLGDASTQLMVKINDVMDETRSGFVDLTGEKVYQGYRQYLEKFITLKPEHLTTEDVELIFTIDDPSGILEGPLDPLTNTFNTKIIEDIGTVTITLHVTINQYDNNGNLVATATDSEQLNILEIVDPNVDKGDNTH